MTRSHDPKQNADMSEVDLAAMTELIDAAIDARSDILSDKTNTCRLFNSFADGIDGFVLERFGKIVVAQIHEGRCRLSESTAKELTDYAAVRLGVKSVYLKRFVKDRSKSLKAVESQHNSPTPWIGEVANEEIATREADTEFLIHPYDGYSTGLFIEHRDNRARVRQLARGKRVLNTFAYTCCYSVCAALGGAKETVSVDISKKFLEWGKRNFAANDLSLDGHWFIADDVFNYYRRAKRQEREFDLIILDPPSFSRDRKSKKVFSVDKDMDRLVAGAAELLAPDGYLLVCTNHRQTHYRQLEKAVRSAAGVRKIVDMQRQPLPADFAGDAEYAKSILAHIE